MKMNSNLTAEILQFYFLTHQYKINEIDFRKNLFSEQSETEIKL